MLASALVLSWMRNIRQLDTITALSPSAARVSIE